jgi:hypothetical protein
MSSSQEAIMSTNAVRSNGATNDAKVARVDTKFEIVVIRVSDVDRAKEFYGRLGGGSTPTTTMVAASA